MSGHKSEEGSLYDILHVNVITYNGIASTLLMSCTFAGGGAFPVYKKMADKIEIFTCNMFTSVLLHSQKTCTK